MNRLKDSILLRQYKGTPKLYDRLLLPVYENIHKTLREINLFEDFLVEKSQNGWEDIVAHEIWYIRKGEKYPESRIYNEEDGSEIIEWIESFSDLCQEFDERKYFINNHLNDLLMELISQDDIDSPKFVYTEIPGLDPYYFQNHLQQWKDQQIASLEKMVKDNPKIMEKEFADIEYFKGLNPNTVEALDEALRYSLGNKKEIIFSHPNEVVIASFLAREELNFDEETNVEYALLIMEMKEQFLKYYIENFTNYLLQVNVKPAIATKNFKKN